MFKVSGTGIISSFGETNNLRVCVNNSPKAKHFNFDNEMALNKSYNKDALQEEYFVVESYHYYLNRVILQKSFQIKNMSWLINKNKLEKEFVFKSFSEIIAKLKEVCIIADLLKDHPDFLVYDYQKLNSHYAPMIMEIRLQKKTMCWRKDWMMFF